MDRSNAVDELKKFLKTSAIDDGAYDTVFLTPNEHAAIIYAIKALESPPVDVEGLRMIFDTGSDTRSSWDMGYSYKSMTQKEYFDARFEAVLRDLKDSHFNTKGKNESNNTTDNLL